MRTVRELAILLLLVSGVSSFTSTCRAGIVYSEITNGTLSHTQATPTNLGSVGLGDNTVTATIGGSNTQDWITINVPGGLNLTSIVLVAYSSTDAQGFTGFQSGSTFAGSAFTAGSYEGYAHFGTGATNGSLPATNLVGTDLMPIMANPADAAGSQGFTPPLGPGNYSFLIQQLGASTNYEFDYVASATAVPEPSPLLLLGVVCPALMLCTFARRARARAASHAN